MKSKSKDEIGGLDSDLLRTVVQSIAGEDGLKIINIILEKDEISDDELAQILGVRVNIVRKILYKLYEHGILIYRGTKDPETNWYIYYWRLNPVGFLDSLRRRRERLLNKLKERLSYEESNMFYICKNKCAILTFDEAIENSFKCPVCGGDLNFYDNTLIKSILKKKITQIEKQTSHL